jgi:hypothetical protein
MIAMQVYDAARTADGHGWDEGRPEKRLKDLDQVPVAATHRRIGCD